MSIKSELNASDLSISDTASESPELLKFQNTGKWLRLKEVTLIAFAGALPRPIGPAVRKILYRLILNQVGQSLAIKGTGVELAGAKWIKIGNNVNMQRDVGLNAFAHNSEIRLDDGVFLNRGVEINVSPPLGNCHIRVGSQTKIGPYTCIFGPGHVSIGKACLIASFVGIYASNYNISDPTRNIKDQGYTCKGIVIEDDCWLGTGVKVLDGVVIGQGSVIGAGAVVTKNIPAYSVAVGVPAKVISSRLSET